MSSSKLTNFPDELILLIFEALHDRKTVKSFASTCKRLWSFIDGNTYAGKTVWRSIRIKEGWPDPSHLEMSDEHFLNIHYGRGCSFCRNHPLIRTPVWEFGGLRLCKDCFKTQTVRDYQHVPQILQDSLPHVRREYYRNTFVNGSYMVFLKSDVKKTIHLSDGELAIIKQHANKVVLFRNLYEENVSKISFRKLQKDALLRAARGENIDLSVKTTWPHLFDLLAIESATLQNACKRTTNFSKSADTRLKKALTAEIEKDIDYYGRHQLRSILSQETGLRPGKLEYSHTFRELQNTMNHLPNREELLPYVSLIQQEVVVHEEKKSTRQKWCAKAAYIYGNDLWWKLAKEFRQSDLFLKANEKDEHHFLSFVGDLYKRELQRTWLKKYGHKRINARLRDSDAFINPTPIREDEFRSLSSQLLSEIRTEYSQELQVLLADENRNTEPLFYCKGCSWCSRVGATGHDILNHVSRSRPNTRTRSFCAVGLISWSDVTL